ncbi:hypothetical protein P9VFCI_141 [Rhizobium phage P9VFCI]|uniref:Uncharacterized protein n=1 Tax=Rhizobium phage P9VFCI TaxID=2763531 RepID=A0A7G7WXM0_9CAUD|nr:hypothetical protein PP937_gp141 [Rhizobium phage P9VFCI]QNH71964.1 hypothetical protein P9VFCI_141 [Rhizobium phage P9VFCI]
MESYFLAKNTITSYYLRQPVAPDLGERAAFRVSGPLVKFQSLFDAVDFFKTSRFDTSKVDIQKIVPVIDEAWTFGNAEKLSEKLRA